MPRNPLALVMIALLMGILVWSFISPLSATTWFMEVAPALAGGVILIATYRKFPFTTMVYVMLWFHAIVLMVGGKYTYAENPLFEWIKEALDLDRNHYDRFGHFMQGFVPAMVTREILIRKSPLEPGKWMFFIVSCICLAISAVYEFVEWWVAVSKGEGDQEAIDFLGTQGDVWDAQWDMFMCLCGAVLAQVLLSKLHDKYLKKYTVSA